MGNKIFISYKYGDKNVQNILGPESFLSCKVRDYVDVIEQELKDKTDHIYKGESDGEDLSKLSDETIWAKLKDRIYDSTLTIVMVSKGMREPYRAEKHQWIPQEISYSLKEMKRKNKNGDPITSKTNALLAVILPDSLGNYSYFTGQKSCCEKSCTYYNTDSKSIFPIMAGNMFNEICISGEKCSSGHSVFRGECNYMKCVEWDDFKGNMEKYINEAYKIQENQENYDIQKELEP